MSETGNRFVKVVLNPDQVDALDRNQPRVFLCGPPGTGKTLVLCLRALKWLKDGHVVSVVSTWTRSLAVSHVIFQQVRQMAGAVAALNLHFHDGSRSNKETVDDLATKVDAQGRVFIIADEISGRSHGLVRVTNLTCVCVCVRAGGRVCVCVRACVRACVHGKSFHVLMQKGKGLRISNLALLLVVFKRRRCSERDKLT